MYLKYFKVAITFLTMIFRGISNFKNERERLLSQIEMLVEENRKLETLVKNLEINLNEQVELNSRIRDELSSLPVYTSNTNVKGVIDEKDNHDAIDRINSVFGRLRS